VAAPAASAATVTVSGMFTVENPPTNVTQQPLPGGRCLTKLTTTFRFPGPGGLQGAFTARFEITSQDAPCTFPPSGHQTFVARGTFTGSVAGLGSGKFKFVFSGTIDPAENAQGTLVVESGSGGLGGLQGAVQLSGTSGVGGTYSGTLTR
jgi:hypothetical protein